MTYPPSPHGVRTGWIVGGIAGAAVLVLVVVIVVASAVRGSGSDGDSRAGRQQEVSTRTPTVAPGEAPASTPPPIGDEPSAADTAYVYVADVCEGVDYSPVLDLIAAVGAPSEWDDSSHEVSDGSYARCNIDLDDGTAYGFLHADVYTRDDPARARSDYQVTLEQGGAQVPDRVEEADGPWQEGELRLGDATMDTAVQIYALDGNLFLDISVFLNDSVLTEEELADAVVQIAEQVLEVSAG